MADCSVNLESTDSNELYAKGVRAYAVSDFDVAISAFARASELLVAEHGEKYDGLGEIYYFYGKTLLDISRDESGPLGDAVPNSLDEESDDSMVEGKEEQPETNGSGVNKHSETEVTEATSSEKPDGVDTCKVKEEKTASTAGPSSTTVEKPADAEDTTEATLAEDEPTDLQLAWEVLEIAKQIFQERGEAGKDYMASTLILLGEVSLESENFEDGISDIKEGLELQKTIYDKHDRKLAETYYKLGIGYSADNQLDHAIENFASAVEILKFKVAQLKEKGDEASLDEIKEIESLLPEIEERISDLKAFREEALQKLATSLQIKPASPEKKFEASSSTKQATDISHLVKRKRKLEEVVGDCESNPSKKQANA